MSIGAYVFAFDSEGHLKSQGLSGMFIQPLKYVGSPGIGLVVGRLGDVSIYDDPKENGGHHASNMVSAAYLIDSNVSKIIKYAEDNIDGTHRFDGIQISELSTCEWGYHGKKDLAACWVSEEFGRSNLHWDLQLDGDPKPTDFSYIAKVLDVLCGGGKYFEPGFIHKDELQHYLNAVEENAYQVCKQLRKFGDLGAYFGNDSIEIDGPLPKPFLKKELE